MRSDALVDWILRDPGLTAGLEDPEARQLVEWLVERAENWRRAGMSESARAGRMRQMLGHLRGVRQFIHLWCHQRDHGAALQLAATLRFPESLPTPEEDDPCHLMLQFLRWVDGLCPVAA